MMLSKSPLVTGAIVGGLLISGAQAAESKKRKPANSVETVMERQIRNAVDAGEGDIETRLLRQRVVEDPSDINARLALGAAYERQGADELAIEHYRVASVTYGSEAGLSRLARTLDRLGESEQASTVLVQFCDSHARVSSRILSELGILLDEMGKLEAGEQYHKRALSAALVEGVSGQDALHNNLGYNLIAQRRYAEAEAQLRIALELNPRSETARNNLAYALSSPAAATAGQIQEALLQWQSLSGPAAAHNNLAAVYLEQKRYPEARRELERAIGFDSSNGAALKNMASLAELDGKPAQVAVAAPVREPAPAKSNFLRRFFARNKIKNNKQAAELEAVRRN